MMKVVQIAILILWVCFGTQLNAEGKRYEVKSGIIEYTLNGESNMMGMKSKISGSAKTVFKAWGAVERSEQTSQTSVMGNTQSTHTMTKIMDQKVYVVDFDRQVIYEYTPQMLASSPNSELVNRGKEMMKSMGAKKIGEEDFMGYACEIWQVMGTKVWLYKGIMLKSQTEMMGVTHTSEATRIEFGASVSENDLKLPDFPIQEPPAMPGQEEHEMPQMSPEQMQQMQEMMKNFGAR
jgi:hypothetical protein